MRAIKKWAHRLLASPLYNIKISNPEKIDKKDERKMNETRVTETEYEKMRYRCAQALSTQKRRVTLGHIYAAENGGYRLIVKYKNFYLYEMYYHGTTVTGYARVI